MTQISIVELYAPDDIHAPTSSWHIVTAVRRTPEREHNLMYLVEVQDNQHYRVMDVPDELPPSPPWKDMTQHEKTQWLIRRVGRVVYARYANFIPNLMYIKAVFHGALQSMADPMLVEFARPDDPQRDTRNHRPVPVWDIQECHDVKSNGTP